MESTDKRIRLDYCNIVCIQALGHEIGYADRVDPSSLVTITAPLSDSATAATQPGLCTQLVGI